MVLSGVETKITGILSNTIRTHIVKARPKRLLINNTHIFKKINPNQQVRDIGINELPTSHK